jgi:Holliday junction resolvasome RuvABC endonuclease subunit
MAYLLGIDPSLRKAGYVVLDMDGPDDLIVEKGLLKTDDSDGILIQRLLKQQDQIKKKLEEYNINVVGMEAPFFGGNEAEHLFALNQFIHEIFLERGTYVVAIPPQQLKKLTLPDLSVADIGKAQMIDAAKEFLNIFGKKLANDIADAFWAGYFGKRFYKLFVLKTLKEEDLKKYEREVFCGKHTFTRGIKKGFTEYTGYIYRENQMFFDFEKIKRRQADAKEKREMGIEKGICREES